MSISKSEKQSKMHLTHEVQNIYEETLASMMIINMRCKILCIYLGLLHYTDSNQPNKMDIKMTIVI